MQHTVKTPDFRYFVREGHPYFCEMRKGCSQNKVKVPVVRTKAAIGALLKLILFFLVALPPSVANGQETSGFMPLNRLGVSYQKALGIDLGLGAYNLLFGRNNASFFDVSIGTDAIFAKRFMLVPKMNIDVGIPVPPSGELTLGGGADIGWATDFSDGGIRFTPKFGITASSVIRLYYGYHIYSQTLLPQRIGHHRISLEVNIAAFHDFKIGL